MYAVFSYDWCFVLLFLSYFYVSMLHLGENFSTENDWRKKKYLIHQKTGHIWDSHFYVDLHIYKL